MAKRYRVVSQGAVLSGKQEEEVYQALLNIKLQPQQARALLSGPMVIKADLDNPKALHYVDVFSKLGLQVKIEGYQAAGTQSASPQDETFALLEKTFSHPIEPTALSREYQKSMVLALLSAVIAPAIYGALVAAVVLALAWYLFSGHVEYFGSIGERAHNLRPTTWIVLLLVPSVIGGILLLFLLYPLWPRGRAPSPYILDRKKNPRFYRLTEQMAQAIGVPAPEFIELIPDVNAAAGPVKGMVSLWQGKLRLVVGLSLVSGCTVQELVGIIAHEYGHFSQRKSMLVYAWINRVTRWLSECAHGQDFWHHRLLQWRENYDDVPAIYFTLLATDYALRGVRLLFQQLLEIHIKMTSRVSQQMEFDADLYEAKVVGSERFRAGSLSLRKLAYAASYVRHHNFDALDQRDKLLKNIPAAVEDIARRYSDEIMNKIEQSLGDEQTEYWHSHPADIERIRHAEQAQEPGILSCALPAKLLFNDFDRLCEKSTMGLYNAYGIHGARDYVVDNDQVLG